MSNHNIITITMNSTSLTDDKEKNLPMTLSAVTSEAAGSPPVKDNVYVKQDAPPTSTASEIPDGGFVAWLQCAGSFFLFFNCWGIVNTFGEWSTKLENGHQLLIILPKACIRPSTSKSFYPTNRPPISHGLAPSRPFCWYLAAWLQAPYMIMAIFAL